MSEIAFTTGAALFGWLLPEFVLMLSPRAENFRQVPLFINLLSVVAFGCLGYGVSA